MKIQILKRNGLEVEFNPSKILTRIKKASKGLKVDADDLFLKVTQGIADKMTTKSMDDLISRTAAGLTSRHPDYSKLASNICVSRHHKETNSDFLKTMKELYYAGVVTNSFLDKVKENIDLFQKEIDYHRDYNFDYFGWCTLEEVYLLKVEDKIYERPQDMYMRVAIHLNDEVSDILAYYNLISTQKISPATPILLNSGTKNGSLISCNLTYNIGDTRDGLLDTYKNICTASSAAEGIGLAMHNIRSKDSYVGGNGKAGGLLKYIKQVNEGMRFFNQRGKRPGACAIYIEPWHKDVEDVLEIRKNTGKDELRARDLFLALWIPDLFMKTVYEDGVWYKFCPNDIKKAGLKAFDTIYGEEFEAEYFKAVELGIGKPTQAKEMWFKILDAQIETGVPYILFKDAINRKSAQKNIGTIKSSNLCAEITLFSDPETTAQCILSSIPLQKFLKDGAIDYKAMKSAVHYIVKSLNKVVDTNKYSSKQAKKGGTDQRALAIGVQGLADLFAELGYSFTSSEAKALNKEVFEAIYFFALESSNQLAKEQGRTYPFFEGSPASEGILQFDMWGLTEADLSGKWDWSKLKENIKKYGLLNSNLTGLMPTASSANLIGSNECFEAFTYNMYKRKVKAGEFIILNKHLVRDLEKAGLWNDVIRGEIIKNSGSIQDIPVIEDELKEKYKTVYEIKQKEIITMCAERAPFIDQTQSMNIFMANPTVSTLTSSHFYAWRQGLKTGMYYLRSEPIDMRAKHLGEDLTKVEQAHTPSPNSESDISCFGCSS